MKKNDYICNHGYTVSGQYGLTDTITEFALSSSGYITYLKINGKKAI